MGIDNVCRKKGHGFNYDCNKRYLLKLEHKPNEINLFKIGIFVFKFIFY
jgi:hypothetical protein